MATCLLSVIALKAALIAISVLPNPTSPYKSRSIGWGLFRSSKTSLIASAWSGVSLCGKLFISSERISMSGL